MDSYSVAISCACSSNVSLLDFILKPQQDDWQANKLCMKVQDKQLTEQSDLMVCTHPELSFWTQQPNSLSRSLAFWIRLTIWLSWRMHGENLAPRWIRSSWKVEEIIVKIHKHDTHTQSIPYMHYFRLLIKFLYLLKSLTSAICLTF